MGVEIAAPKMPPSLLRLRACEHKRYIAHLTPPQPGSQKKQGGEIINIFEPWLRGERERRKTGDPFKVFANDSFSSALIWKPFCGEEIEDAISRREDDEDGWKRGVGE